MVARNRRLSGRSLVIRRTQTLVTGLAIYGSATGRTLQLGAAAAPQCSAAILHSDSVRLADGRLVTLDAQSVAVTRGSMVVVGPYTHIWPANAHRGAAPLDEGSAIGWIRLSDGSFKLVPNPLPGSSLEAPRVASAGRGAWHVVFAIGFAGKGSTRIDLDSAQIWYGRLVGTQWRELYRIGTFAHLRVAMEFASNLAVANGTLAVAFPFQKAAVPKPEVRVNYGLLALRRVGGVWRTDTIPNFDDVPNAVRLAAIPGTSSFLAAIVQSSFESHHSLAAQLFVSRLDRRWTKPIAVAGDGRTPVFEAPVIQLLDRSSAFIGWGVTNPNDISRRQLEWGRFDPYSLRPLRRSVELTEGIGAGDFAAVLLADATAAWFIRDSMSQARLRMLVVDAKAHLHDLGTLPIPMDNPRPLATRLSDSLIVVISSKMAASSADLVATTLVTTVRVTCGPAQ